MSLIITVPEWLSVFVAIYLVLLSFNSLLSLYEYYLERKLRSALKQAGASGR